MKLLLEGPKRSIIAQKSLRMGPNPDQKNSQKPMSVKPINMKRVSTFSRGLNAPRYMFTICKVFLEFDENSM